MATCHPSHPFHPKSNCFKASGHCCLTSLQPSHWVFLKLTKAQLCPGYNSQQVCPEGLGIAKAQLSKLQLLLEVSALGGLYAWSLILFSGEGQLCLQHGSQCISINSESRSNSPLILKILESLLPYFLLSIGSLFFITDKIATTSSIRYELVLLAWKRPLQYSTDHGVLGASGKFSKAECFCIVLFRAPLP